MLNTLKTILLASVLVFSFSSIIYSQEDAKRNSDNGIGSSDSQKVNQNTESATNLRILSKTPSKYTDEARKNSVEGSVRLRVTFLASGEIGSISPATSLPFGLTEQAIAAARQIKFTPATRNGVPTTVIKTVEFNFSLYYGENDKDLMQNAEIIENSTPEHPQENNLDKIGGKVKLEVALIADGKIEVIKVTSDLPKEFEKSAVEAASKIKFKPAIHKNGHAVTQIKVIEYEFKSQKS